MRLAGSALSRDLSAGSNGQRVFFPGADFRIYLKLRQMNLADGPVRALAYCYAT